MTSLPWISMTGTHPNAETTLSRSLKNRRWPSRAVIDFVLLMCAILLASRTAEANTYMFTISTSDLMNALQTAQGNSIYSESAYFAVFLQPSSAQISSYSFVSETAPTDPNPWVNSSITDYADTYFYSSGTCSSNCTWAEFEKNPTLTDGGDVTLISGANGGTGGQNIFMNGDFFGTGANPPLGWGPSDLIINRIMPTTDVFSILISTSQVLSGSYTLIGRASALKSGNSSSMSVDTKESDGISFTLSETIQPLTTPEPETWVFAAIGMICLIVGRLRRKPELNNSRLTAQPHRSQTTAGI